MSSNAALQCWHCGRMIDSITPLQADTAHGKQPVCCNGCLAVAESLAPKIPAPIKPQWQRYDVAAIQDKLAHKLQDGSSEISLAADAIHCASCSLLIEREFDKIDGVLETDVNVTHRRLRIRWLPQQVSLGYLLQRLDDLGFTSQPLGERSNNDILENRLALKRILVAGLGMMQVMMYAVGLYAGMFQGISDDMRQLLYIVSMIVATPVVLYAGRPFFGAAWRDIKHLRTGMDVPVALAIAIAYTASVYAVLFGGDHVYFDSVTMFIFFLSLGRFAEMKARHRAGAAADAFAKLSPATAVRWRDGQETVVAIDELKIGDMLIIKPGETIAADCRIVEGSTQVDESLLTGESRLLNRTTGELLIGGSVNHSGILKACVEKTGDDTVLSHIGRLLQRAQTEKPPLARLADRVASYFVAAIIAIATAVGCYWAQTEPSRAMEIVLALLVVTCPCALSLATPAALSVAIGRFAREGLLVTRGDAIEQLAHSSYALFDKTGTLTYGYLNIRRCQTLTPLGEQQCLQIAATLERASEHPIAAAFKDIPNPLTASDIVYYPGLGIEGRIDTRGQTTRHRIGKIDFVAELGRDPAPAHPPGAIDSSWIALGDQHQLLAWFELGDIPRPDIGTVCAQLKQLGLQMEMLSGDQATAVNYLAMKLGIRSRAQLTPEAKLNVIRRLQHCGERVLMVGDGVNDAPVLAGADVSIAMSSGTHLAQTSADMVLMNNDLHALPLAIRTARRTLAIVKQNIGWAVAYNLSAVPLAAMGLIAPWLAAIGMSASSLLVVLNALRIGQTRHSSLPHETQRKPDVALK